MIDGLTAVWNVSIDRKFWRMTGEFSLKNNLKSSLLREIETADLARKLIKHGKYQRYRH